MIKALGPHLFTYLALMAVLGLTLGGAYLPLHSLNLPLALFFAATKTVLVGTFFMELRKGDNLLRVVAFVGLVWLGLLLMLALTDYFSRAPGNLLG
jgi:cytochrome c oxidase subunit 4